MTKMPIPTPATAKSHLARKVGPGGTRQGPRLLADEVAVALTYNGSTQAVMMATPADLDDFARGFTLTEGIALPPEVDSVTVVETPLGIDLQIWLVPGAEARLSARRRSRAGPVGCGLCGIDSLEQALQPPRAVPASTFRLTSAQVLAAMAALEGQQPLQDMTRSSHAAGFWQQDAAMLVREDVGRHNALDKLAGALIGQDTGMGAVVLTSRVSIDLVQKCATLGAPVLIAVSAPTAAAVTMAEAAGITLVALTRADSFEIFTHPDRIDTKDTPHAT